MKAIVRIPTTQYGYVEFEIDGTPEEVFEFHNDQYDLYNSGGDGLSAVEFGKLRNEYRKTGKMTPEMQEKYHACSKFQKIRIGDLVKDLRDSR